MASPRALRPERRVTACTADLKSIRSATVTSPHSRLQAPPKVIDATKAVTPGGAGAPPAPAPTLSAGQAAEALAARKVRYELVGVHGADYYVEGPMVWVRAAALGGQWLQVAGELDAPIIDPDTWPGRVEVYNRGLTPILRVYEGSPLAWQSWRIEFEIGSMTPVPHRLLPPALRAALPTFATLGVV